MVTTLEGTYKDGAIVLDKAPEGIQEGHVLVVFPPIEERPKLRRMMHLGMFSGPYKTTLDDFKIAEWRGDAESSNG